MKLVLLIFIMLYMLTLAFAFLRKKHIESKELELFSKLIILNIVGLVIEIVLVICCWTLSTVNPFTIFLARVFLIYLISFAFLITIYVRYVSLDSYHFDKNLIIFYRFFIPLVILFSISFFILPIDFDGLNSDYCTGLAVNCAYVYCGISFIYCMFTMITHYKNLNSKKCLPLIIFFIGIFVSTVIQRFYPQITIATIVESFCLFIMYFTIENPDVKMIEKLNIAKTQAEQANNAKSEFLSNMSHEIRTPLNAIVGFSQALKEEDIPDSAKDEVNDIIMASESLLDIVNGILDISKIESGKLEIVNTEYSTKKIFDDLVSLTKARLGDKPLDFRINIDPSMPAYLYGDYVRLKQIILNLLTNAVKYTKEGYIEFKVSTVKKDNICRIIASVEDSGIGIKKEKIDKLFTKFERFDLEKNITIEGTGLGLAITKKLIELMNGKIVVQSIYGQGSRFTVAIDQRIVETPVDDTIKEVTSEFVSFNATGKRILVVDDNKVNLKVASRLLKDYQAEIVETDNGYDCIQRIRSGEKFDLILMDDMMPKMSGVETLKHLKEDSSYSIPTIALTANAISGMKEKYLSSGFDDYLSKPIDKNELNRVIRKFLDTK